MTKILTERPARRHPPTVPSEAVQLAAPPADQGPTGGSGWHSVIPALGSLGALVYVATDPKPITIVAGGLFALTAMAGTVVMAIANHRSRYRQRATQRHVYLDYLESISSTATATAETQRASLTERHPPPRGLVDIARTPARVWERRRDHEDFLDVRLGVGHLPLATPLTRWNDPGPLTSLDPVLLQAADDVLRRHSAVSGLPLAISMSRLGVVSVVGDHEATLALARAALGQLAAFHAPADVRIGVLHDPGAAARWSWLLWLPHAATSSTGGTGTAVLDDPDLLAATLASLVDGQAVDTAAADPHRPPWLVLVVDRGAAGVTFEPPEDRAVAGMTVLHLARNPDDRPARLDAVVRLGGDGRASLERRDETTVFRADGLTVTEADALARLLAPLELAGDAAGEHEHAAAGTAAVALTDLLGIDDPRTFDLAASWRERPVRDLLRVPFAMDDAGAVVELDLKEAALGGLGPHGLMIGATGSGKSEALRTIVLGLALRHSPEIASFVLVDFKGGAAFAGLARLPHVAGLITNLADDAMLVERMHDALSGELRRRQELLRATGSLESVWEYREQRTTRQDLPPLPNLLVVIDEFAELLAARPDFVDLFNAIGRLGRSLGIHLLFASQQLDEGRLRGLESNLSYRIALRTFKAAESRAVIGTDDAFRLPSTPGVGLLLDARGLRRFRVALSSGPYRRSAEPASGRRPQPEHLEPHLLGSAPRPLRAIEAEADAPARATRPDPKGSTVLDELVAAIGRVDAPTTHPVWLPPLPPALTMDQLLGPISRDERRGLTAREAPGGSLLAPFGLADLPTVQRLEVSVHDFTGAGSSLLIVGAPQSGKSTLLRAVVAGLALTHTPEEVQVYVIDLGGGGVEALGRLPHVGAVATRTGPERVSRIVREAVNLVAARERLFARHGLDGIAAYRARRAARELPGEPYGDVFVVIDNWAAFRTEFEELEQPVVELAGRAAGYGVHFVVTANRAMDLRTGLRDLLGGRLELRLADPADSEIDRRAAGRLTISGRCLRSDGSQVQVALARLDGNADPTTTADGARDLAEKSAEAWEGSPAPPVNLLPLGVRLGDLAADPSRPGVPVGIGEADLGPVHLDLFSGDPHLLVFGETASGKTTLLRTLAVALTDRYSPDEIRFVVADPRRTLVEALPEPYVAAYCPTPLAIEEAIGRLTTTMTEREPPADVTVDQLRTRSWWSGPEIVVLVDDYDLVSTARQNPLAPVAEWLPHAADLGLHVVLARRSGGASRAMYDPVIQQMRELGDHGFLLSGDPNEGPLLANVRPVPQPPGRGVLVRRREHSVVVQIATVDDARSGP